MCLTTAKPAWRTRLSQIPGAASEALGPQISAQECATRSVKSLFSGVLHQPRIHQERTPAAAQAPARPRPSLPRGRQGGPLHLPGPLGRRATGHPGVCQSRALFFLPCGWLCRRGGPRPFTLYMRILERAYCVLGRVLGMCWQIKRTSAPFLGSSSRGIM